MPRTRSTEVPNWMMVAAYFLAAVALVCLCVLFAL